MDTGFDPELSRAIAWEQMEANRERRGAEARAKPFRFEDLNGKPEPASWGPVYPKTASAAVEKWRRVARERELTSEETREYGQAVHAWINALNAPKRAEGTVSTRSNCASGQANDYSAAKHRASLRAAFHAQAAADRLAWATGKATNRQRQTIKDCYRQAMVAKRARLAAAPKPHLTFNWREARIVAAAA
jgi:hypothetical protein